jgi:hypothetical protein
MTEITLECHGPVRILTLDAPSGATGLARAMAASFRDQLGPPGVPWPLALEAERGAQMWPLRDTARFGRS